VFVHTGRINIKFFDPQLQTTLSDIEVAVNRAYECVAAYYGSCQVMIIRIMYTQQRHC
jgi:hypothetical protein